MSRNEITGDLIVSRATNQDEYAKGWDAVFGKKQQEVLEDNDFYVIGGGFPDGDKSSMNELMASVGRFLDSPEGKKFAESIRGKPVGISAGFGDGSYSSDVVLRRDGKYKPIEDCVNNT